ncbi:hypothetical protein AALO_G00173080 [Alosa alosa]|uniref:EF-hand domain-containing protein n=1 Tax=Alosa alosa TaxID=278164 RepID=A0AAV6GAG3_9TELE|nr:hypothetical protein AALO_G00173080 [Alosa alosa]
MCKESCTSLHLIQVFIYKNADRDKCAMAGYGPWVAVLSLFCLLSAVQLEKVMVVPLVADPSVDADQVCALYSDGLFLRIIDVYDMIKEKFQHYVRGEADEEVMEFMKYADRDGDEQLNLKECKALVDHITSG